MQRATLLLVRWRFACTRPCLNCWTGGSYFMKFLNSAAEPNSFCYGYRQRGTLNFRKKSIINFMSKYLPQATMANICERIISNRSLAMSGSMSFMITWSFHYKYLSSFEWLPCGMFSALWMRHGLRTFLKFPLSFWFLAAVSSFNHSDTSWRKLAVVTLSVIPGTLQLQIHCGFNRTAWYVVSMWQLVALKKKSSWISWFSTPTRKTLFWRGGSSNAYSTPNVHRCIA